MDIAYNIIIAVVLIASSPYWLIRLALDANFRKEFQRRTRQWKSLPRQKACIWVHASSVGEVRVARLMIQALQREMADRAVVLSTSTATGFDTASMDSRCPVIQLPLDLPFLIQPLLKRLNPALLVLIEAEFWPNVLRACKKRGIPVLLTNGRMSAKSYTRYQRLKPWFLWLTEPVSLFAMRSQLESDRLIQLGIEPERVETTGNMKFDSGSPGSEVRESDKSANSAVTVVFGSTRPGEEASVAEAISHLIKKPLNWDFIVAPRHVSRCGEVEDILRSRGLEYQLHSRLTEGPQKKRAPILLVDTLGVLNDYYRHASIAYVGGGFDSKHGGHNILEPAQLGLPVLYGKSMGNFEEEARLLSESGGGIPLEKPGDLTAALENLVEHPEEIRRRGQLASETVRRHQGAVRRNLELIQRLLKV